MHSFSIEKSFLTAGYASVIGVDEAGRGPLAGPVVAASFFFAEPSNRFVFLSGVDDSKKISSKKREYIYDMLINEFSDCIDFAVVDHLEVDRINIFQATMLAMKNSLRSLGEADNAIVLVDGNHRIPNILTQQKSYIKGDSKVFSIAAASIIAKVTRDKIMTELDKKYPQYGFAKNMGYGTKEHLEALAQHGPCPIHRRTYAPIKNSVVNK